MTLEQNAIKLHAEVYGWVYEGAETVLTDKCVSIHVLLLWCSRLEMLVNQSKKLALAVQTEQAKRAWVKARDLEKRMKERYKREYGGEY